MLAGLTAIENVTFDPHRRGPSVAVSVCTHTRRGRSVKPRRSELISLTRHECLHFLRDGGVGVVAFDRGYGPEVLPVTYAADEETLLFRTGTTSRLAVETDGCLVAFETHGLEPALRDAWSVIIRGIARVSRDNEPAGTDLTVEPWAPGEHGTTILLSMALSQITGRQLTPGSGGHTLVSVD
jgi:hypothetical protein